MALPTAYNGATYADILRAQVAAFGAGNGTFRATGATWSRFTNGQGLALLQTWRKIATAYKERMSLWPDLWWSLLGWRKQGDKFQMTLAHASTPADDYLVELTWRSILLLVDTLDRLYPGVKPPPVVIDFSWKGYERAAKDAWAQMRSNAGRKNPVSNPSGTPIGHGTTPPPPATSYPPQATVNNPASSAPSGGNAGVLLVVLLLLLAERKKRNRRKG